MLAASDKSVLPNQVVNAQPTSHTRSLHSIVNRKMLFARCAMAERRMPYAMLILDELDHLWTINGRAGACGSIGTRRMCCAYAFVVVGLVLLFFVHHFCLSGLRNTKDGDSPLGIE